MNVMVDLRESVPKVKETFNGVDFVTLQDLLDKFEDLVYKLASKEEEIDDLKLDMESNYKKIDANCDFYGMSENDF